MKQRFKFTAIALLFFAFIALNSCTTITQERREQAEYRLEIAYGLMRGRNYPMALKELLVAEDQDPKNAAVQAALGAVYFARDRFEYAEKHYLKALSLRPNFTEAKNSLARAYIETGRYNRADELLKQAVNDLTYSNYQVTYDNLGYLEFKRANYQKAIYYLKKSLEKDRENCSTQVMLGRSLLESGEGELAVSQLERSLSFCSAQENDEGHYYSAIALYRDKKSDKALLRFEELISLFPNGPNNEKARKMIALIKKDAE